MEKLRYFAEVRGACKKTLERSMSGMGSAPFFSTRLFKACSFGCSQLFILLLELFTFGHCSDIAGDCTQSGFNQYLPVLYQVGNICNISRCANWLMVICDSPFSEADLARVRGRRWGTVPLLWGSCWSSAGCWRTPWSTTCPPPTRSRSALTWR
jgi:hypothetical protein